jgi:hypothetical protein
VTYRSSRNRHVGDQGPADLGLDVVAFFGYQHPDVGKMHPRPGLYVQAIHHQSLTGRGSVLATTDLDDGVHHGLPWSLAVASERPFGRPSR